MNLGELIKDIRSDLDDEVGQDSEKLWSDRELTEYINEAIEQLCIELPLIKDISTSAVCQIALAVGTGLYALHDSIVEIISAKISGETVYLTRTSHQILDSSDADWKAIDGLPGKYAMDVETDKIALNRLPEEIGTLELHVQRTPLVELNYDSIDGTPEINARYHRRLKPWAKHRAYSKQDSEVQDTAKAAFHEKAHNVAVESIRKQLSKRERTVRTVTPQAHSL